MSGNAAAAVAQSRSPSIQRNDFFSSRVLGRSASGGGGRAKVRAQQAQRHAVGVQRQGPVQVQPAGGGAGLVRTDEAQPFGLGAAGEVQCRGVLHAQHGVVRAQPLQGALAMRREDVPDRHRAVGGSVDEPVMSLDQGARSVGRAGDGAHRGLCHKVGALHQTGAQARIAQGGAAELVGRPGRGVQALPGGQRRRSRGGHAETLAPVRLQLVQIHRLGRAGAGMGAVVAPAPGSFPDPHPVGRAQARAGVRAFVDEGLDQQRPEAVPALEVLAHGAHGAAQRPGGQIMAIHARADQHPAQPRDAVQVRTPSRLVPADPGVAGRQPPRRGREPDRPQPTVRRTHQITHLATDERAGAARMFTPHQRVPEFALRVGVDPHQPQIAHLAHRARHRLGRRHRPPQLPGPTTAPGARRRQPQAPVGFQRPQRPTATGPLPAALAVAQVERLAHPVGQRADAPNALRHRAVEHLAKPTRIGPQTVRDLRLNLHAPHRKPTAA